MEKRVKQKFENAKKSSNIEEFLKASGLYGEPDF